MSTDKKKFENVKEGMMTTEESPEHKLKAVSQKLEKAIEKKQLQETVSMTYDNKGLHLEFKDKVLFSSGSADLSPEHQKVVKDVVKVLKDLSSEYHLMIEGHTDDVPLHNHELFASNWELSSARGISMMRWFKNVGIAEDHMSVISYAHTHPKVDIKDLKGAELQKARAANRRVIIRIE